MMKQHFKNKIIIILIKTNTNRKVKMEINSPTNAVEQALYDVDTKQFKEILKTMTHEFDMLIAISRAIALLPKDRALLVDGKSFGKIEAKSLYSQYKAKIMELSKYLKEAKRKKKRVLKPKYDEFGNIVPRKNTLTDPAFFVGEFLNFMQTADFGLSYVKAGNEWVSGAPLKSLIPNAVNGLLNSQFKLMSLYQRTNRTPGSKVFPAPPAMRQAFAGSINQLIQTDQINARYRKPTKKQIADGVPLYNVDGETKVVAPGFSPEDIKFTDFSRLISLSRVKTTDLSQEQKAILSDPNTIAAVRTETAIISSTLDYYKELDEAAKVPKSPSRRTANRQITLSPARSQRQPTTNPVIAGPLSPLNVQQVNQINATNFGATRVGLISQPENVVVGGQVVNTGINAPLSAVGTPSTYVPPVGPLNVNSVQVQEIGQSLGLPSSQ